jgi:hypothetical protein
MLSAYFVGRFGAQIRNSCKTGPRRRRPWEAALSAGLKFACPAGGRSGGVQDGKPSSCSRRIRVACGDVEKGELVATGLIITSAIAPAPASVAGWST